MVYQYYIIEIKRLGSGELEHEVSWVYDEDAIKAQLKGESKFHERAAVAALSDTLSHAVTLIATDGSLTGSICYEHKVAGE